MQMEALTVALKTMKFVSAQIFSQAIGVIAEQDM